MTAQSPDRPLLGILLVVVTVFFMAISDVLTKHLTQTYPVPLVVAVRYLASLAILLAVVLPFAGRRLWRTRRTGLVLLRAGVLTMASLTMGFALRLMPVGETVAIMYLSPIAVMLLAMPVLGERVGPAGWALAVLGFTGVLLIVRPGGGLDPVGVACAVANAACATVFHLMTRVLGRTESSLALLFWVSLTGAVAFSGLAAPHLLGPLPPPGDLGLMALLGLVATTGHFLFAVAYRQAPASLIAPVNYMHLVWAGVLGWAVFGHVPGAPGLLGMGMVAASGVLLAVGSRYGGRRVHPVATEAP